MRHKLGLLLLCLFISNSYAVVQNSPEQPADVSTAFESFSKALKQTLISLGRQVIQAAEANEELVRTLGDSGLVQIRHSVGGTRPYHAPTYTGRGFASIHDHSNNIRTVGMGEFGAILNGVLFRTRHNDYRLYQPHPTSRDYHATVPIEFPQVPPEVLNKTSVYDQVLEMREWFRAWNLQNTKHRDYRPYFRPVMCYLEAAWTKTSKNIDEPFESDRHFLDANDWFDLQEKVSFGAYTGRKSELENWAFLPTKMFDIKDDGGPIPIPVFAQFNYRIACHPLKHDLPLNRLRVVDDVSTRMAMKLQLEKFVTTRATRFSLDPFNTGDWSQERYARYTLMDELMSEIPGKDNYAANITDNVINNILYDVSSKQRKVLNGGYYNRIGKVLRRGAMGLTLRNRGYSDASLWVALNTQDKIMGKSAYMCDYRGRNCKYWPQTVSYCIPLEIIYMTPLSRWNPYNIPFKGKSYTTDGRTVTADGRWGGMTEKTAYNGTNERVYYITPASFFASDEVNVDAADTARTRAVGVLDANGKVRPVRASGTRIFTPNIPSVGALRTRWPVSPTYFDGGADRKSIEALQDIIMEPSRYMYMLRDKPTYGIVENEEEDDMSKYKDVFLKTTDSSGKGERHHHTLLIEAKDVATLRTGKSVPLFTSKNVAHQHTLVMVFKNNAYQYIMCDGESKCRDGHSKYLSITSRQK